MAKALARRDTKLALPAWKEPKTTDAAAKTIGSLALSMHENAYQIGKHLIWVKTKGGHGNFLPWLEKNVKAFKKSSAENFMDYAERCDEAKRLEELWYKKIPKFGNSAAPPPLPEGKFALILADPPGATTSTPRTRRRTRRPWT